MIKWYVLLCVLCLLIYFMRYHIQHWWYKLRGNKAQMKLEKEQKKLAKLLVKRKILDEKIRARDENKMEK